jgi:hypothetical protein
VTDAEVPSLHDAEHPLELQLVVAPSQLAVAQQQLDSHPESPSVFKK